jgi:hypothetical protein
VPGATRAKRGVHAAAQLSRPAATTLLFAWLNVRQLSAHWLRLIVPIVWVPPAKVPAGNGCAPLSPLPLLVQLDQT